ncbi:MFS transporter [Cupriavidus numazuensis]|uniref:Hexuronate transporter n=1 Tax=Cupriavidus numazuensis TaxID=221992 RepID=A0ABN7QAJ1_9BURK|nr:MFS transporter [Cupriavidus numazuensis]CAG2157041.1 Hexuronate transporter [Cupriavidus numazuensis]
MLWTQANAAQRRKIRNWQYYALGIGVLGELFLAGDWYGFAAVMTFVTEALHLSPTQAGFVQGAFAITYCLGMLFWSPFARRWSARRLFAIGLLGTGAFMLAQAAASSFTELVAARLLIGFFDAAVWVGTMKLIVAWFPSERHGATMGVLLAAFSLAITLDFAIGIPVAAALGWRVFLLALGVLTLVVGLLGLLTIKGSPREIGFPAFRWQAGPDVDHHAANVPLSHIFRSRWIYVGWLAIFGDTFALAATATWVVPAFIQQQGMPVANAALVGTLMGLSQVAFLLIGGWLSDRMPRVAMLKLGALLSVASALSFVAATYYAMPWAMLLTIAGLSGATVLSGGAIFSLVSERYGEALAATAIGYAELGGIVSTFIAPTLMGFVIDVTHSFTAAFMAFLAVEVAVLLALLMLAGERRAEPAAVVAH